VSEKTAAVRHHIRAWRKHRALTQEQLADATGISRSYLTKIENGARRYDQASLERIAEALHCAPADLIRRHPTEADGVDEIWAAMSLEERTKAGAVLRAMFRHRA